MPHTHKHPLTLSAQQEAFCLMMCCLNIQQSQNQPRSPLVFQPTPVGVSEVCWPLASEVTATVTLTNHHKEDPSHLADCHENCPFDLPDCHQHTTARWMLPAGSQGGAVYMINATSLAIEQSSFVNNTALTGGGIYMSRVTNTYIYDTLFHSNNVTQAGGGIYSGMPLMPCTCAVFYSSAKYEVC